MFRETSYLLAILFYLSSIHLVCGTPNEDDFNDVRSEFQVTGDGFHR
jgi:hypothetical protein